MRAGTASVPGYSQAWQDTTHKRATPSRLFHAFCIMDGSTTAGTVHSGLSHWPSPQSAGQVQHTLPSFLTSAAAANDTGHNGHSDSGGRTGTGLRSKGSSVLSKTCDTILSRHRRESTRQSLPGYPVAASGSSYQTSFPVFLCKHPPGERRMMGSRWKKRPA